MIRHGKPPYLECSSAGDKNFSALFARIINRNFQSIEGLYQSAKRFEVGTPGTNAYGQMINWRNAKGKKALNQAELVAFYDTLWDEYLKENPHLLKILCQASGLSDQFGQPGHICQASTLWAIRAKALGQKHHDHQPHWIHP